MPCIALNIAQIEAEQGHVGSGRGGRFNVPQCRHEISLLIGNETEQVQRIWKARMLSQGLLITGLGLCKPAILVRGHGTFHERIERSARAGRRRFGRSGHDRVMRAGGESLQENRQCSEVAEDTPSVSAM